MWLENKELSSYKNCLYFGKNEESDVYKAMKKVLPRLTKNEWAAFTRLITLICFDMETDCD